MNACLVLVLTNAVIATGLFAIVFACKSRIRNPAVLHMLWIVVLLKLLTPPLWSPQWAWLPASESAAAPFAETTVVRNVDSQIALDLQSLPTTERQSSNPVQSVGVVDHSSEVQSPTSAALSAGSLRVMASSVSPLLLAVIVWGAGAILWWGLSIGRIVRLQRCLRFAQEAPVEIQHTTAVLAQQLGLRRVPRVWLVPGRVSPMLWTFCGPALIIVPSELFDELDEPARETLLLHELAHYRRGDHWVRWLELVSLGLYWWHPIVWLLRREIRLAEELACDACVVSQRPADKRAYAEMLVYTVAFLSSAEAPAVATGVGTKSNLEGRLRKIMSSTINARVAGRVKVLEGALAILVLPLAPVLVRAQRADVNKTDPPRKAPNSASALTEKQKSVEKPAVPADELLATVVDEKGKPVAGAEVTGFLDVRPLDLKLQTDSAGQFRIPRSWHSDDNYDPQAILIVRQGKERLGWLDLQSLRTPASKKQRAAAAPASALEIVLYPRTRMVRGMFVDPDGKPLSQVRVMVDALWQGNHFGINHYHVEKDELGAATTDQTGSFVLQLPSGTDASLEPEHPDWLRTRIVLKRDVNDLGRITLGRAGRIHGRVVDASTNKPLSGQRVFAQAQGDKQGVRDFIMYGSAETDLDGKYVIGGISPGRFNVLVGGSVPKTPNEPSLTAKAIEGLDVVLGKPVQANFELTTGRRLSGKVVDVETEQPVAKIHVGYYGPARPNSGAACLMVRTKADGSFEFRVPPGVSKVYVASGDRQPAVDSHRTLEVPADRDLVDIVLQAGLKSRNSFDAVAVEELATEFKPAERDQPAAYKVRVKLQTPEGKNVNQADARTVFRGSQYTSTWTALSSTGYEIGFNPNEDGRTAFLMINANGFATARSTEFVVRKKMPDLQVQLTPEVRVPVRGRVVDEAGKAVAAARVRIARSIYGREKEFPWGLEYSTDNDGRFEIKHARLGDRIRVHIDKPGSGGVETDWYLLSGTEPLVLPDLRVGKANQDVGGVVQAPNGFPVANAKVIHTTEPRMATTTDANGKFQMSGLPTGTLFLTIESAGVPRYVCSAQAGKLDNRLIINQTSKQDDADYRATITLKPRDGKEITHMMILYGVENGELLSWRPDVGGNSHSIGFAGEARRHKGQNFAVVVAAEGYAQSKPFIIPNQRNPNSIVIDLDPAPTVTLRGRVVDEAGQPVSEARVGLSVAVNDHASYEPWRYWGLTEKVPRTDADGKFEIPGILRNSRVAVYINKAGYSGVWSERITVEKPQDIQYPELRLPAATGVFSGRVVDEQGRPVADAAVDVLDIGHIKTQTDNEGRFRLDKAPNRETWLRVTSESGEWTQKLTPDATDLKVQLKLSD